MRCGMAQSVGRIGRVCNKVDFCWLHCLYDRNPVLFEFSTVLFTIRHSVPSIKLFLYGFVDSQLTNNPASDNLLVGYPTIAFVGKIDNCEMRRDKHGISNPGIRRQTGF